MNVMLTFSDLDAISAPDASLPFDGGLWVAGVLTGQGHGLVLLDLDLVTERLPHQLWTAPCGLWRRVSKHGA